MIWQLWKLLIFGQTTLFYNANSLLYDLLQFVLIPSIVHWSQLHLWIPLQSPLPSLVKPFILNFHCIFSFLSLLSGDIGNWKKKKNSINKILYSVSSCTSLPSTCELVRRSTGKSSRCSITTATSRFTRSTRRPASTGPSLFRYTASSTLYSLVLISRSSKELALSSGCPLWRIQGALSC